MIAAINEPALTEAARCLGEAKAVGVGGLFYHVGCWRKADVTASPRNVSVEGKADKCRAHANFRFDPVHPRSSGAQCCRLRSRHRLRCMISAAVKERSITAARALVARRVGIVTGERKPRVAHRRASDPPFNL